MALTVMHASKGAAVESTSKIATKLAKRRTLSLYALTLAVLGLRHCRTGVECGMTLEFRSQNFVVKLRSWKFKSSFSPLDN